MTAPIDRTDAGPVTVGVLYPPGYHRRAEELDEEVRRLAELDPRVRVLVEPYVDPDELRTRRSAPGYRRSPEDTTELSDSQRRVLAQLDAAIVLDLPFDTPQLAPRLRWVQSVGTGIGQLRSAGLAEAGIALTNAAGTSAPEIAEFVLARILEHHKRLPELAAAQAEVRWRPVYGRGLSDMTIGLAGLGAINGEVARLARAFGMRVLATRRDPGTSHPHVDEVVGSDRLVEMVRRCDVVVSALPETPETDAAFDARAFAAMADHALFVNVGRGSAVVDRDLLDALDEGRLAAAALDVFAEEPLPPEHPYWTHPKVRVSAHCSSVPATSIARVHELFRDNLRRLLAGEALRNVVDLDRGY